MMALWFIMSGKTEPKFLILGALSSMVIAYICLKTLTVEGLKTDQTYFLLGVNIPRFIAYFAWLLLQIAGSAFYVSKVSLFEMSKVEPSIVWFRADYDNPAARAMLANSITLTPGTITIDITEDGIFSVHGLTQELRDGVLDGSMQAKVAWLYGETVDFAPVDASEVRSEGGNMRPVPVRMKYSNRRKSL
jgi:multicomponent Na+:H+ antiporter subunit E